MPFPESELPSKSEYVWVQVPSSELAAVYELLAVAHRRKAPFEKPAELASGGAALANPSAAGSVDGWDLQELQRMVNESDRAMRSILRALATVKLDDEWLPIARLEASLEHRSQTSKHTVPGTLGAFGRRVKNRYSWERWPFQVRRGSNKVRWEYWMPPALRSVILDFLDRAPPCR